MSIAAFDLTPSIALADFADTLAIACDAEASGRIDQCRELLEQIGAEYEPATRTFVFSVTRVHRYQLPVECEIGVRYRITADDEIRHADVVFGRPAAGGPAYLSFNAEGQSATIERTEDGDKVIAKTRVGSTTVVIGAEWPTGSLSESFALSTSPVGTLTIGTPTWPGSHFTQAGQRAEFAFDGDRWRMVGGNAQRAVHAPPRSRTPAKRRKQRRGW